MKKILCMLLVTCFFNYSTINSQTPFPEFFTDARAGNASVRGGMTLQTGGAGKGAEGVAATFLSSQVNSKESAPLLGNAPFSGLASMVASNTAHNSAPGFFSQSRTSLNSQKIASIPSLNFGAGLDMKYEEPDSPSNSNQKGGILTDKRYAAVSQSPQMLDLTQSDELDDFFEEDALFLLTLVGNTPQEASAWDDLPVHLGNDYKNIDEWGFDLLDGRVSPANSGADPLLFEDASSPEFEFDRNSNYSLSYCDSDHELGILDDEYETEDEEGSSSPLFGISSSPGADLTTFADLSAEERAAIQQALGTLNKKETASWGADYYINSDDEPLSPARSRRSSVSRSQPDDTYFL